MRAQLLAGTVAGIGAIGASGCCFFGANPNPRSPAASPSLPAPSAGRTCHIEVTVHFPSVKPTTGQAWDVAGGAPDPILVVRQDGLIVGQGAVARDTMIGSWALDVACDPSRDLQIDVLDHDLSADDPATSFVIGPYDASMEDTDGPFFSSWSIERR